MGKKGVPDWLNSSLWTSNDRIARYDTKSYLETRPDSPSPTRPNPFPSLHPPDSPAEEGSESETEPPARFTPDEAARQSQLIIEISKKVINVGELQRLVCQGVPDGTEIRSTIWKFLLRYLPSDRSLWMHELDKKRSQYKYFKDDLLNPDTEIVEQIDRDVMRTHPAMQFFSEDSAFAKSNQEALRHILFVFAKLNLVIRYVQGMNEVLAPLFYVFRNDPDENNAANAEADTFFCFVELLSGFRDNFCKQLDNSVVGIHSTIAKLSPLIKKHDEELWRHLEITTKVNPQFYAFRLITLLLTQEFNFTDCLHIWDTLLSDLEGPQETLLRICCAMLLLVRRRLLAGDFTSNLKLLQNYPTTNISQLLHVANKLRGSLCC